MKRIGRTWGVLWLVSTLGGAAPAPEPSAFAWLEGSWGSVENGVETEERWSSPAGGALLGINKAVRDGKLVSFEFLRIARVEGGADDGRLAYISQPGGAPPTVFLLVESSDRHALFANPSHDFPQRISYRRDEDGTLVARIEGTVDGREQAMEWRWKRR